MKTRGEVAYGEGKAIWFSTPPLLFVLAHASLDGKLESYQETASPPKNKKSYSEFIAKKCDLFCDLLPTR